MTDPPKVRRVHYVSESGEHLQAVVVEAERIPEGLTCEVWAIKDGASLKVPGALHAEACKRPGAWHWPER